MGMTEGPQPAPLQFPALVTFDGAVRATPRRILDCSEHLEACSTVDAFVDRALQEARKPQASAALVVDEVITENLATSGSASSSSPRIAYTGAVPTSTLPSIEDAMTLAPAEVADTAALAQ